MDRIPQNNAPRFIRRGRVEAGIPRWQSRLIFAGNRWGRDVWLFVICFVSLLTFFMGIYCGGKVMVNRYAPMQQQMKETQKQLKQCDSSVILVDKDFAAQIGFSAGKKDLICTNGM